MKKQLLIIMLALNFMGCASAMRGSNQQIELETYVYPSGETILCDCELRNDDGTILMKSNRIATVHRDKDLLHIHCENDDYEGSKSVDGEINLGYWAIDFFLIDACIITGWIDGLSGAWAEYPSFIEVPMKLKED